MSSQRLVKRKGEGSRLNDRQRLEIIALLEQPKPPSMRNMARQYGVDDKTIRKLKANVCLVYTPTCSSMRTFSNDTLEYVEQPSNDSAQLHYYSFFL